jgi:RNase H-fold protein (predicted Holliday junction resolvase)
VETWDESGSTQIARRQASGAQQLDALAACVILQEYLDAQAR